LIQEKETAVDIPVYFPVVIITLIRIGTPTSDTEELKRAKEVRCLVWDPAQLYRLLIARNEISMEDAR